MTTLTRTSKDAPTLSILLIDDDEVDAQWIERSLGRHGQFDIHHSTTLADGLEAAKERPVDLVLLDLGLPDGQGVGNLEQIMEHASAPIVVLTGLDDERVAIEAMGLGAQDYIVKGAFDATGLAKSIRFATERHRLMRELDEASRRESEIKDKFLSHVSHELRTPLTAVMQFVTILSDGIAGEVNAQQAEYLGIIQRNAEQLKHMIGTLMDVTRAATGKLTCHPTRVSIDSIVTRAVQCLEAAAVKKNMTITADCPRGLPEVIADARRVEQVLDNLLENALKFSPDGGDVRVEIEAEAGAGEVIVAVVDQGPGVPPEAQKQVFDRLYQQENQSDVSRKGLGLGLHICSEIVSLHGGRIWVENREGAGACFRFTLPLFSLRRAAERILVVDGVTQPAVALIAVTITAVTGRARAKGVAAILDHARKLFESCMIGSTDTVLPVREATGHSQVILGLARTGPEGAESIATRVRQEIQRDEQLHEQGFEGKVLCRNHALDVDVSTDQALRIVAQALQGEIELLEGGSR